MMEKAILQWENLTQAQADEIFASFEAESKTGLAVTSYSFETYDATNPKYDPKDKKTWTEDLWLGRLTIFVVGDSARKFTTDLEKKTRAPLVSKEVKPEDAEWELAKTGAERMQETR